MSDETRKIQLSTEVDSRGAREGLQDVVRAAEGMATGVKTAADKAGKAVDNIGSGGDVAAQKLDKASRSIAASIQRTTAQLEAGDRASSKYFETLARQRGADVDALRPYLQQLDAAKAKQDAASASLGNMGTTARQTAAALRGVPAQFTDIITSLQGGQQPLTVLLQQGGQLKDMFGGAGAAARALGGYVVGMINPVTLAAGAVGALGYAAYTGAEELQAFNKSLILTGGAAGVTGDRLMTIASSISAVGNGITQSKAAEALNMLVEAGVRGEQQLGRYGKAAAEFERAGGSAVDKVAKGFEALGKDPLQASLKLNESMGYLTASTYDTIRSLEAQGKTVEAVKVAQDAYANAIETRTPQLVQNIGLIETAWRDVSYAMGKVWDQMKNIGRTDTLTQQLAGTAASIDTYQRLAAGGGLLGQFAAGKVGDLKTQQEDLRRKIAAQDFDARIAAQDARKRDADIAWLKFKETNLDKTVRVEREIAAIRQKGMAAGASELEIQKEISKYREANSKKASTGGRGRAADPFSAERDAAKDWAQYLQKFGDMAADAEGKTMGLNKAQALLVEYLKSPAYANVAENMRQLVLQNFYAADSAIKAEEAFKKEQAAILAAANAFADRVEKEQGTAFAIAEQVRQQQEATAAYGLSGAALVDLEVARLNDAAAEKERLAVIAAGIDPAYAQAYRDQAQGLRELAAAKMVDASVRQQTDQYREMWQGVEGFARSAFDALTSDGENASKRIGDAIRRDIKQALYELTIKQWIVTLSGGSMGSGGTGNWITQAVQSYIGKTATTSAATTATTTAATTATGAAAGSSATGAAAAGGTGSAAASSSWMSYAGYAALIYAAMQYGSKLYDQGYNRNMLGDGQANVAYWGNGNRTSGYTDNAGYDYTPYKYRRELFEALGMSKKWADIMSSTTRWAHMFGRSLSGYGYNVSLNDGNVSVGGYESYKSGWAGRLMGRGNKEFAVSVNSDNAARVQLEAEAVRNGTRAMAEAMGYSADAIDHYTGSIKVNMKGANTAAEQSERMSKAMDDLQYALLKTATGGKMARAEFDNLMTGVKESIQAAGISTAGIADILVQGMTGRLSQAEVGDQLASTIVGGIYNAIAGQYASVIAQSFTQQIITPIFTALAAGVPISQAISQASINSVVQTAQNAAAALNAIFQDAGFMAAISGVQEAISGITLAVGSVQAPEINNGMAQAEQQRYQIEGELLGLLGNTNLLRERELSSLDGGAAALKRWVYAMQDARAGVDSALSAVERSINAERDRVNGLLQTARDSESALNDVFRNLRDNIRDLRGEVADAVLSDAVSARARIAGAVSGVKPLSSDDLSSAIDAVRAGLEKNIYSTAVERDLAFLRFAGELSQLQDVTESGLSEAERQVSLLEEQLTTLDAQMELAKSQVDALYGVDTSVKSVGDAIANLSAAMENYSSTVAGAMSQSFSSGGAPSYNFGGFDFGGGAESGGSNWTAAGYWQKNPDIRQYYEANSAALDRQFGNRDAYLEWHWKNIAIPNGEPRAYAKGGYYPGGLAMVGEQGPELINFDRPGQVYTAAQTQNLLGGNDSETRALLRDVIARLDAVAGNTEAGALHASRMATVLRKASREGGALAVQAPEATPVEVKVVA